jgi:uncharacterized membrane protein YheB (UPF0754 family)
MNIALFGVSVGVGAVIGYVTNYVAIKLLFRPYKPLKIGNITVFPQGVIPREKEALARKVGEVVRDYILSEEEIKKIVTSDEVKEEIEKFLDEKIRNLLDKDITEYVSKEEIADKLSSIISKVVEEKFSMFASLVNKDMIKNLLLNLQMPLKLNELLPEEKIKEVLKKEIFDFLEKEVPKIFLKAHIDKIVEEKVASFDEKKLEDMLFSLMDKHFGFINFAGAVLGAIIGAVQYLIVSKL